MDRAPVSLTAVKACKDCAHHVFTGFMDRCERAIKVDFQTGEESHWSCSSERNSGLPTDCGPQAIHFIPSEAAQAARSIRRLQRQQQIEQAIVEFNPDATQAQEILDALLQAIGARYEDAAADAMQAGKDFREALDELERTTSL